MYCKDFCELLFLFRSISKDCIALVTEEKCLMISYYYENLRYIERYIVEIELYVLLLIILPLLFFKQYLKILGGFFFKMPLAELSFLTRILPFIDRFFENLNFKPFIAYGIISLKALFSRKPFYVGFNHYTSITS